MVYKSPFFTTILGEYIFSTFPSIEQANPSQNHGLSSPKGEQRWNAGTSYHLGFDGFWPTTVADRWSKASILLHPNNGGGWFRWVFLQTTWMILRWTRRYIFRGVYVSSFEEWTLLMELPVRQSLYLYFKYWQKRGDKSHSTQPAFPCRTSSSLRHLAAETLGVSGWVSQASKNNNKKTPTEQWNKSCLFRNIGICFIMIILPSYELIYWIYWVL